MTPEAREILLECRRLELEHAAAVRPKYPLTARDDHDAGTALGPTWTTGWFGDYLPDALRMRYSRALRELVRLGLVVPFSLWSRISRIRLTEAGVAEVDRICAEMEAKP